MYQLHTYAIGHSTNVAEQRNKEIDLLRGFSIDMLLPNCHFLVKTWSLIIVLATRAEN